MRGHEDQVYFYNVLCKHKTWLTVRNSGHLEYPELNLRSPCNLGAKKKNLTQNLAFSISYSSRLDVFL